MSDNKTAELMVEAFLKSGLSTTDAMKEIKHAEKKKRKKKERESRLTNLLFLHIPAVGVGVLMFVLFVGRF